MKPGQLSGDVGSLIVRALLDFRTLWTTHDLVTTTGVPVQSIRRTINGLERDGLVERRAPGVVAVPSWFALLRRWNDDVRFNRDARVTYWRSKQGTQSVLDHIPTTELRHAVTGSHAARVWAPDTPPGATVIYTPDAQLAAAVLELIPARTKTIVLAEPPTEVVYTRTRKTNTGLRLAAPTQVLADLITGAAKSPTAANPLLTWMLDHELEWRY
ncbi:hypothetical protein [Kribbella sp. NPDC003557]|uniref:hypothetical protein n=1 Tax=Kribbella sp. NPDC003557 TaxID=3154449 RepID=UPI0033BAB0A9